MKYFIITLCLYTSLLSAQNENYKIDSLTQVFEQLEEGRPLEKLKVLSKIIYSIKKSNPNFEQWVSKARNIQSNDSLSLFYTNSILGRLEMAQKQYSTAIEYFEEAIQNSSSESDLTFLSRVYYELSNAYSRIGNFEQSISVLSKAVEYCRNQPNSIEKEKLLPLYLSNLGMRYFNSGNIADGMSYLDEAVELTNENNDIDALGFKGNKGIALAQSGNLKDALNIFLKTLEDSKKLGNKNFTGLQYMNVREVLVRMKDYDRFFSYGDLALGFFEETGDSYEYMRVLKSNGDVYRSMKNYDKAKEINARALEIADSLNIYKSQSDILNSIATIHIDLNEFDDAINILEKSIRICNEYNITYSKEKAEGKLGRAYFYKYEYVKALPLLEKTYYGMIVKNDVLATIEMQENLSKCYYELGLFKKAFDFKSSYEAINDSLLNERNIREMTQIEEGYKLERRETQLNAEKNQTRNIAVGSGLVAIMFSIFFLNARRKNKIIADANVELDKLNHTKNQIFSVIGHDLKKPALSFRGIAKKMKYLIDNKQYDRLLRFGESIEDEANQLNKLTDNLLSWALLQKDLLTLKVERIELNELTQDVMELLLKIAEDKQVTIYNNIDPIYVESDRNILSIVIRNLLDNAIKYSKPNDQIIIESELVNDNIELRVIDSGHGIRPSKIPNLFLLYKGKSKDGTTGEKGTGLGLHIVKELVQKARGTIHVDSILGEGTTFRIQLPTSIH